MEPKKQTEENASSGGRAVGFLALIALLLWPKKSVKARGVEIRTPAHLVPRAKNQAGQVEKS